MALDLLGFGHAAKPGLSYTQHLWERYVSDGLQRVRLGRLLRGGLGGGDAVRGGQLLGHDGQHGAVGLRRVPGGPRVLTGRDVADAVCGWQQTAPLDECVIWKHLCGSAARV